MINIFQARVLDSTDPWDKIEIDTATRQRAEQAAAAAGLSVEEWLERAIQRAGAKDPRLKPIALEAEASPIPAETPTLAELEEEDREVILETTAPPTFLPPALLGPEISDPPQPQRNARKAFRWMLMGGSIAAAIAGGVLSAQYLIPEDSRSIRVALAPTIPTNTPSNDAPGSVIPTAVSTASEIGAAGTAPPLSASAEPVAAPPASPAIAPVSATPTATAALTPASSSDASAAASSGKASPQAIESAPRKTALAKPPAVPESVSRNPPVAKTPPNGAKSDKSEAPSDPRQLAAWLEQRVKNGDSIAQYRLGVLYALGEGVTQDYQRAASLFKTAAEEGVTEAQYNVAVMYAEGLGTRRDPNQAVFWYRKAAAQGSASAAFNLGVAYSNGVGVERNMEQAVQWFRHAAEGGVVNAQFNIGLLYERGDGVAPSQIEAYAWYATAAARGDGGAAQRRDRLASALSPAVLKDAQARASQLQTTLQSASGNRASTTPAALTPSFAKKP